MKHLFSLGLLLCCAMCAGAQNLAAALTANTWRVTGLSIDKEGDGTPEKDLWQACEGGSTFTFSGNGSAVYYKGPDRCEKSEAASSPFGWTVTDPTHFTMEANGGTESIAVQDITGTGLALWFTKSHIRFVLSK